MKIMNQRVEHKRFGQGTIFALKDQKVYVKFGKIYGDKVFPYPDVFEGDMIMCDRDAQEEIQDDVRAMKRRRES